MILACHNIEKAFGEREIVRDGSFHIEDREKAALVGVNGAGKSTILKMIIGEEPLDGGEVILAKGKTLGYLAQRQDLKSGNTIYEEVKSAKADIFAMEAQIRSIEHELKHLEGEELQSRLETYNRLQSEFDARNGYACESEITGVLKGLGLRKTILINRQIHFQEVRRPVFLSENYCLQVRISSCLMSRQTTWI